MISQIYRNFEMYFPWIAKDVVSSYESGMVLFVTLSDGSRMAYDEIYNSIRQLPKDSNNLTEEECRREFANRLRSIMITKGFNQQRLSETTGIRQHVLSGYMTGRNMPNFYNLDKIAKALRCSLDDFSYRDSER